MGVKKCDTCKGTGIKTIYHSCPTCGGRGVLDIDAPGYGKGVWFKRCPDCEATRKYDEQVPCPRCDGLGFHFE